MCSRKQTAHIGNESASKLNFSTVCYWWYHFFATFLFVVCEIYGYWQ